MKKKDEKPSIKYQIEIFPHNKANWEKSPLWKRFIRKNLSHGIDLPVKWKQTYFIESYGGHLVENLLLWSFRLGGSKSSHQRSCTSIPEKIDIKIIIVFPTN